jgi:WD40 repeat protein
LWHTSHETENGHFQNKYSGAFPVFSPDGTSVALATQNDLQVQILNLETGTKPVSFSCSGVPLQYNSDGSVLIVLTDDSIIHFDSMSSIPRKEFMLKFNPITVGNKHGPAKVICSNRLGVFLSKGNNPKESKIHVIDLYDGDSKFVLPSSSNSRQVFNISKDGQKMAVVNELLNSNRVIEIWDLEIQEQIPEIHTQHTRWINYLEFSPDGMSVASWSIDSTIGLWELESGKQLHRLEGHKRDATGGSFSLDGMTLVSVNSDRSMKLWNIHTGREVASFNLPSAALFSTFSPDGRFLIAYGNDLKGCRIWQAPTMEQILQDSL